MKYLIIGIVALIFVGCLCRFVFRPAKKFTDADKNNDQYIGN